MARDADQAEPLSESDRRLSERYEVTWSVDCEAEDTFLYARIANISELGIFVRTIEPLAIGTELSLRFTPPGEDELVTLGVVQWVNPVRTPGDNPNPGMGVRFVDLAPDTRERLVAVVRTIAYLREPLPAR